MRLKKFPMPTVIGIAPILRDAHLEAIIAAAPTHVQWPHIAALVHHSNRRIRAKVRAQSLTHAP